MGLTVRAGIAQADGLLDGLDNRHSGSIEQAALRMTGSCGGVSLIGNRSEVVGR